MFVAGLLGRPTRVRHRTSRPRQQPVLRGAGALVAIVITTVACSSVSCKAVANWAIAVRVRDASGKAVCDATVTVRDGAFSSQLAVFLPGTQSCVYRGAQERRGTYSVEVQSGTTTKRVDGVTVSADQCNVITREITVDLSP